MRKGSTSKGWKRRIEVEAKMILDKLRRSLQIQQKEMVGTRVYPEN
jgi:hypothetical protein